jgi:hypothetical protein
MSAADMRPPCFSGECTKINATDESLKSFCRNSMYLITKAGGVELLEGNPCAMDVSIDLTAGINTEPGVEKIRENLRMISGFGNVIITENG